MKKLNGNRGRNVIILNTISELVMVKGISQWFLAVLDEKYCLEQLRGEAGNSLYFVGFVKCEPIDVLFFSKATYFPLVCLTLPYLISAFSCANPYSARLSRLQASLFWQENVRKKKWTFTALFKGQSVSYTCLIIYRAANISRWCNINC